MNPVFWFLVVLLLILVWFLLGVAFKSIGDFFLDLYDGAVEGMTEEDDEKETEDENQ